MNIFLLIENCAGDTEVVAGFSKEEDANTACNNKTTVNREGRKIRKHGLPGDLLG